MNKQRILSHETQNFDGIMTQIFNGLFDSEHIILKSQPFIKLYDLCISFIITDNAILEAKNSIKYDDTGIYKMIHRRQKQIIICTTEEYQSIYQFVFLENYELIIIPNLLHFKEYSSLPKTIYQESDNGINNWDSIKLDLDEYLLLQKKNIVEALNDPLRFPLAIEHPDKFPSHLKAEQNVRWDNRVRNNRAFIRTYKNYIPEFWIDITYTRYRKAFKRFLWEYFKVDPKKLCRSYHVDHFINRAFAKQHGVNFVRLILLDAKQNTTYGSKMEKNYLKLHHHSRFIFLINYLCAMKALGIKVPKNKNDYINRKKEIADIFRENGVIFLKNRGPEIVLDGYFKSYPVL